MLTLLKLIRNLFKQLKSDLTPSQIAVGAFLGMVAALTPFGVHLVLILTIALLVNGFFFVGKGIAAIARLSAQRVRAASQVVR